MITSLTVLLLAGGALIGFLLAVLRAGGSILLLPLLVSGAALPTKVAVPLSLLVVTLLAVGNLGPYLRRRQVAIKPALILGLPALAASWIGGSVVKAGLIPEQVQLGIFAAAALLASWLMVRPRALAQPSSDRSSTGSPMALAGQGVLVGLLTGIAGVGGGFAIVPALVLVAFVALGHWPADHLPLMLPLIGSGAIGAIIGQRLAPHLPELQLRQGFSALLIGSALLTGFEAWERHHRPLAALRAAASRQAVPFPSGVSSTFLFLSPNAGPP
jgi:uncharacterized protein